MKITVIGELCEDIFIYGESKKLCPEAPVPIFTPSHVNKNEGMSGNVVRNIKSIEKNTRVDLFHQSEKITKTRYVDFKSNHMFLRIDEGEESIAPIKLCDKVIDSIKQSDALIISDYNKGFLPYEILHELTINAKFSILDTKKLINSDIISYFNFIKLNETEFNNQKSINFNNKNNVIVTLGHKGVLFNNEIFPAYKPKKTIDVSGAGDTFIASFTLKYLKTLNITESILFANKMCSIVVSKSGVSIPK
jgi:D-beta-D-heptose 7-phosphate kinase/D-beta-D-heptose 1-phosphate adenosyltransferase